MQHLLTANTLADMRLAAVEIVQHLQQHPIVLLKGELGAGKTTLAQMICEILGVKEVVTSPTYTLVNEYISATGQKIYHFDLYRLEKKEELDGFGFIEYLDSGNICLIEWPEIAATYFTGFTTLEINIHKKEEGREITLQHTLTT
jgi:tRNA threonylcarbamoyladenosine biosynthesis protein TsaE